MKSKRALSQQMTYMKKSVRVRKFLNIYPRKRAIINGIGPMINENI